MDLFFKTVFGTSYENFRQSCHRTVINRLSSNAPNPTPPDTTESEAMKNIKAWVMVLKPALIKYKLNVLFMPTKKSLKQGIEYRCKCGTKIRDVHLKSCRHLKQFAENITAPFTLEAIDTILKEPAKSIDTETLNLLSDLLTKMQTEVIKVFEVKQG